MKATLVTLTTLLAACSAILVQRNEDLNKRFHVQDDLGNFKFGYHVNEINGAFHDRHPLRGAVDKAYSNGRFQYGAEIRGIPFSNRWKYGHLPAPLPAPVRAGGEINWLLSSAHQAQRVLPPHKYGIPHHPANDKYYVVPPTYPYSH